MEASNTFHLDPKPEGLFSRDRRLRIPSYVHNVQEPRGTSNLKKTSGPQKTATSFVLAASKSEASHIPSQQSESARNIAAEFLRSTSNFRILTFSFQRPVGAGFSSFPFRGPGVSRRRTRAISNLIPLPCQRPFCFFFKKNRQMLIYRRKPRPGIFTKSFSRHPKYAREY